MEKLRVPGKGCFKAGFPRVEWKRVGCVTAANIPYQPDHGPRPFTVGGNNDYSAEVAGLISSAEGSFDSVTGVTSESGPAGGLGAPVADTYTLQLNTKPFKTTACGVAPADPPSPNCQGWAQFVYSSAQANILVQYWLLKYNKTCPSGWIPFSFPPPSTDRYCYRNSAAATVAKQPISNLANLRLNGSASAAGNDTVTMFVGGTMAHADNVDSLLNLAAGWKAAEFMIVGDGRGSQATFNNGATIVVRTTVHSGTRDAPTCVVEGFTGETNNLDLMTTAAIGTAAAPSIVSTQSNVTPAAAASCQAAKGTGEPHLTTFDGLLYDFQASGDFTLAQRGPDFVVQTRQVTLVPSSPNLAVNNAVATRMGTTRVAVCLPNKLVINGQTRTVNQGTPLRLPSGVDIQHIGNTYLIRGQHGDSLRAQLNNGYIDVTVGLGRNPTSSQGLLANPNSNPSQLATRSGAILTEPLTFAQLYQLYGNSWRVTKNNYLRCKATGVGSGNPTKPFSVKNLNPDTARRARATCVAAGVQQGALLNACTLDVATLGPAAAKAFVGVPPPAAVGTPP